MYIPRHYGMGSIFRDFDRFRRSMDKLIEGYPGSSPATYPAVNVWSNEDRVMVTAEIPGMKPEELDISVRGNTLTLHGKPEADEFEGAYHRRERSPVEWHRTIELPCNVDADGVEARLEKGVLAVAMPRAEVDKPRRITVKAS